MGAFPHQEVWKGRSKLTMSDNPADWVVIDITGMTKTTKKDKILKVLKSAGGGGIRCCKVSDQYHNDARNKNCISITILREDYENEAKQPDYPASWILEEDYNGKPEPAALL